MTNKIYQIKIELKGSKPKIWRRILVSSSLLLSDFHKVIQTTMGWTNSHLHQFISNNTFYLLKMDDDDFWDEMDNVDYSDMKISDLLKKEGDKMIYEYDFGDAWEHNIILEKIDVGKDVDFIPVCIKGKNRCPVEDSGGVWGYSDILNVINDPKNDMYSEIMEWLPPDFDPTYFDIEEVNELLQEEDFGCWSLF